MTTTEMPTDDQQYRESVEVLDDYVEFFEAEEGRKPRLTDVRMDVGSAAADVYRLTTGPARRRRRIA